MEALSLIYKKTAVLSKIKTCAPVLTGAHKDKGSGLCRDLFNFVGLVEQIKARSLRAFIAKPIIFLRNTIIGPRSCVMGFAIPRKGSARYRSTILQAGAKRQRTPRYAAC